MADRPQAPAEFIPALGRLGTRLYDPIVRVTGREKEFKGRLLDLANLAPGNRVLDLGCGTGTLAIAAFDREPLTAMHGIDADPDMLERARAKAQAADAELDLVTGSATNLPYEDESFDVVLSSLVFHHLDREAKSAAARQVARVLKPDGRFLLADWGSPSDPLMRGLFLTIQLVDGFQTTADNVAGRLPAILGSSFDQVVERDRFRTATGSLVILEALRPCAG